MLKIGEIVRVIQEKYNMNLSNAKYYSWVPLLFMTQVSMTSYSIKCTHRRKMCETFNKYLLSTFYSNPLGWDQESELVS